LRKQAIIIGMSCMSLIACGTVNQNNVQTAECIVEESTVQEEETSIQQTEESETLIKEMQTTEEELELMTEVEQTSSEMIEVIETTQEIGEDIESSLSQPIIESVETSVPVSTPIQSTSSNEDISILDKINPETGENYKTGDHITRVQGDGSISDGVVGW